MKIKNIKKSYGKKQVLRSVSFSASKGECVGILGANGCGKSTLMKILAGIIHSDGGSFTHDGEDFFKNGRKRSSALGYVAQTTPLIEELSVKDNLKLWYSTSDLKKELWGGVLSKLGINGFLKTKVSKLSGGMKKRLSIGCSVAHKPCILLLDEPGAALDPVCREQITDYITDFKENGGIVVISTHDAGEIAMCDKLFILKDGELSPYRYDGNIHRLAGLI